MRINTFEVRKHDIEIQGVFVLRSGVLDDCDGDDILVIAAELAATSRALLLISHGANLLSGSNRIALGEEDTDRQSWARRRVAGRWELCADAVNGLA